MSSMEFDRSRSNAPLPSALGSSSNLLSHQISHLLSTSFIDPEISTSLEILENGGFVNNASSRRDLGLNIAMQQLETNKSVLNDYKSIVDQVRMIKSGIESMQSACAQMRIQSNTVKGTTSQLLEQSAFLQQQKKKVEIKRKVLHAFRDRFAIEESELQILTSQDSIDERFFDCLAKVKAIHEQCSVLLVVDTQKAGLEIMETMTKNHDAGYEKLHRWILKELKSTTAGATEANVVLRRALTTLSERRDLYEKTLDHVSDSRRRVVAADFEQARIRGKLEANINDCLRFVGDVLAWLHQAIASEIEVLELVLGVAGRKQPSSYIDEENVSFNYRTMQNELVDRNFSLVLKPLQQRVDQVIVAQDDRLSSFKAAILIRFYRELIDRVLEKDASVTTALKNMEKSAISRFLQSTRNMVAAVNSRPPEVDQTLLEVPFFLQDMNDDLRAVLEVLDQSFLEQKEKEVELTNIWDQLLRQSLDICVRMATTLPGPSQASYIQKCCFAVEEVLSPFTFTQHQIEICQTIMQAVPTSNGIS